LKSTYLLLSLLFLLGSCNFFDKENEEVLARVGNRYLFKKDVAHLVNEDNIQDSASVVSSFIDNWIKKELLLQKALVNLSENQIDFDEQLEDYKNSLLIYAYENLLIKQKLDTVVSEQEVKAYYGKNKNNFKLKENLLKIRFIKLLASAPNKDSVKLWIFSKESDDIIQEYLSDYCRQFASNCHLDTSEWIPYSKIYNYLPRVEGLNEEYYNLGKEEIIEDSLSAVYLKVYDSHKRGEIAPMYYVEGEIKDIIVNKRKIQLLSRVREEIFEEATLKGKYEIFK
jgi:hypothetical protein